MIRWLFGHLACLVAGHREPSIMQMAELDNETLKPTGRGIYICDRCNEICCKV